MEATCPHLTQALLASWKDLAKLITGRHAPWRSMVGVFRTRSKLQIRWPRFGCWLWSAVMESDAREPFKGCAQEKKQKESVHFNVFERFPPKQRKQRASPKWQTWYKFRLSVRLGSQRNCCDVDVSVSLAWKHLETYYGQIPIQHAWTGTKRVAAEWGEWRYLLLWLWLLWPWLSGSWTFQPTLPATFSW